MDFSGTLVWSPLVPESLDNWEVLFIDSHPSLTRLCVSACSYGYTNVKLNPAGPLSLFFLLIVYFWPKIQVAAASKHERLDAFSRIMDSLNVFPTCLNVTSWKLVFVQQNSSMNCALEAFSVHKNVIAIFFAIHCLTFKAVAPVKLYGFFCHLSWLQKTCCHRGSISIDQYTPIEKNLLCFCAFLVLLVSSTLRSRAFLFLCCVLFVCACLWPVHSASMFISNWLVKSRRISTVLMTLQLLLHMIFDM